MNTRRHITRRAAFIATALVVLTVGGAGGVHVGAASSTGGSGSVSRAPATTGCHGLSPASAEGCTSDQFRAALDHDAP